MSIVRTASPARRFPWARVSALVWPAIGLAAVAAAVLVVASMFRASGDQVIENVLVQPVVRGVFEHNVVEPGELESSNNVEVRCEVESRNSSGTVILEIVPNGTEVKPGDFLVRFDASALEQERVQQQISVNDAKALVIQSKTAYETAQISKEEYLEGTFKQDEQVLLGELFVAEENLHRAEEYARYSERLAAKGYVTSDQVEADKFAVEKGRNDVDAVKTKLKVLREYTKRKMVNQLDAAIQTAKASLDSDENSLRVAQEKLEHIDTQIKKCVVNSPAAGKVVYANRTDRRGGTEVIVEEGAIIRERQAVLRLPDLKKMQALAKVSETRVSYVRPGMDSVVRVDAFPGMELKGKVTRVDEFPVAGGWMSQNIKQYATYVMLDDPPPGIRPGLTVQVEINVERIPDSLKVPVQVVFERNGEYYCVVRTSSGFEPRWLDIGPTNDQEVLVRDGVKDGEQVALNPEPLVADMNKLPRAPDGYWDTHPRYESLVRKQGAEGPPAAVGAQGEQAAPKIAGDPGEGGKGRRGDQPRDPGAMISGMFQRFDTNGDGALSSDEMPEQGRERFAAADADGDGKITRAELTAAFARLAAGGGKGPSASPPGGGAQ